MKVSEERLFTLQEVADYLRVSRQSVYNYVTAKKLRAYKVAGHGRHQYRVTEGDLREFMEKGRNV